MTTATLDAFRLHWPDAWGVRMEHILRNCLLTLSEYPDANLSHILKLLTDDHFRSVALQYVTNQQVLNFWHDEYDAYSKQQRSAAIAPIQNKLGALLSDPLLYRIFCEPGEQIDFRKIMDEGQTLVINLAKGKIGADSAGILGAMIVSAIGAAAFSRADIPEQERRPCTVFVDEFQNFTTLAFANMLSELRKYGVTMVLAHQYISQLKPEIREAVFGNCSTLISFRVGASDAPYLAREFAPNFDARDLMNLPNYEVIMKTLWNGRMTQAFRAKTPHPDYTAMLARNPFL